MQDALIRGFNSTVVRVGDVAWRARSHTHFELAIEISLWFEGDGLVGWSWLRTKGGFDLYVVAERRDDQQLWQSMLDEVEAKAMARRRAGDELDELYTFPADEVDVVASLLSSRGFVRENEQRGDILLADLSRVHEPVLPPGYVFGSVTDESDIIGRVEVHRAAFAPSELTAGDYRRVRRTWPYRPELDRIVKTPTGLIVAAATAWLDEHNRAGLIEPVATHPEHQRQGLGRAVVEDALRALRDAGAQIAQIGTSGEAARSVYQAAGFAPWKQEHSFRKRLV